MRLPCSKSPRYMNRKDTVDRRPAEREAKEDYSAKHVSKDVILEKNPYIWGTLMMSFRDQPLRQALSEFLDSQGCEQCKLFFSFTRFWGTLLCNNRYILKYTKNNQIIRGFLK